MKHPPAIATAVSNSLQLPPLPFTSSLLGNCSSLASCLGIVIRVFYHFSTTEVEAEDDTPAQDGTNCDFLLCVRFISLWHSRCISSLSRAIPRVVQGLCPNSLGNPTSLQSKFWLWLSHPHFPGEDTNLGRKYGKVMNKVFSGEGTQTQSSHLDTRQNWNEAISGKVFLNKNISTLKIKIFCSLATSSHHLLLPDSILISKLGPRKDWFHIRVKASNRNSSL